MTNKMNTKVRLVRCPRCSEVLPELADVPLYKCGGCNVVLQAKKRKDVTPEQTADIPQEASSGKQKIDQTSDDREAGSSSNQQSIFSTQEPDKSSDHNEPRSSTELSSHMDPESSPEARAHIGTDKENSPIRQYNRRDQDPNELMYVKKGISEDDKDGTEFGECSREFAESPKEKRPSSELTSHEVEEPSQAAPANAEVIEDPNNVSKSNFKSLIAEKLLDTRLRKTSTTASQSRLDEDDTLTEDESADLSHNRRRFERISSVETLENVPFSNTSYYGYDGSVSSFDGDEDHPNLHLRRNRVVGSKGLSKRHEYHEKMHQEFHPSKNNGQRGKDMMMKLEKDKQQVRGMQSGQGNASPSRLGFSKFHDNFRYHSPAIPENPKLEKLELLKMVQELQDQLDRTTISNAQQVPSYYNRLAAEREGYHLPNYPRYPGRYGQRMAFSGEATTLDRSPVNCSCHRCCPQERHYSAQLPPHIICYNNGPNRSYYNPGPYYSPHYSGSSSPQHHSGSDYSVWAHEMKSTDQRHRNETTKSKHPQVKKRHVRPIASGAPWITCYECSELLQLPQSFLLFKRTYHSLRCSSCSKVLKFSLLNRTHLIRYYPEEMIAAPPSSEVDDYSDSSRIRHASRAEPVSCSDRSFQKSYSTETDKYSLAGPSRNFDRNSTYRKMSSHSSHEPAEERTNPALSPQNRYKGPVATSKDVPGPSSSKLPERKVISEIEEIQPASSGSPLHRLMGYASPSKVIRGS